MVRGRTITTRIRLATGLVLFAYLFTYFANHALGSSALKVMEHGCRPFLGQCRSPIGAAILYGSPSSRPIRRHGWG